MKRVMACLVLAVATSGCSDPYDCGFAVYELDRLYEEYYDRLDNADVLREAEEALNAAREALGEPVEELPEYEPWIRSPAAQSFRADIDSLESEIEANCR